MKKFQLLVTAIFVCTLIGCGDGSGQNDIPEKDKAASSRLDQIAKSSGGDWEKVSQSDKDFLVNEISMGSEASAKKLLQGKAGLLKAQPPGTAGGSAGGPGPTKP